LELLPEVEQQQLRSGNLTEGGVSSCEEVEVPDKFDIPQIPDSLSTSLLIPSSVNSSLLLHRDHPTGLMSSSTLGTSAKIGMSFPNTGPQLGNFGSSSYHRDGLFNSNERVLSHQGKIGKNLRFDNTPIPMNHKINFLNGSPLKGFKRTSPSNSQENMPDKVSPGVERNLRFGHNQTTSSPLYSRKATVNPVITSTVSYPKEFANDLPNVSSWNMQSHTDDRSWNVGSTNDPMDVSQG